MAKYKEENLAGKLHLIFLVAVILTLLIFDDAKASDHELSAIKPIAGKHYAERQHPKGLTWNENYWNSIGLGYRYQFAPDHNIDTNALYVQENSLRNESVYLHLGYVYDIDENWSIGMLGGFRNGYPKKALDREAKDFIASGYGQIEYCIERWCALGMIAPSVAIANLKFKLYRD